MAFSSHVGSVNVSLSFEIDEKAGQEELNSFGYGYTKDGRCMSLLKPNDPPNTERKRVGRFPSQQAYEEFGLALENYVYYSLRTQYQMTPHTSGSDDSKNTEQSQNDSNVSQNSKNEQNESKASETTQNNSQTGQTVQTTENSEKNDKNEKNEQNSENSENSNDKNDKTEKNDKNESNESENASQKGSKYVSDDSEEENTKKTKKIVIKQSTQTIFTSPDYDKKETILLLVPGSGAVRAGQWARSICINDNLASGTMFPFIDLAYERDWGVVLFDPNGKDLEDNSGKNSRFSMFSDGHVIQGYNRYVAPLIYDEKIKNLLIVCHSAGGGATSRLLGGNIERSRAEFAPLDNVLIAGTDTWFIQPNSYNNERDKIYENIYTNNIVNWKTSRKKGDSMLQGSNNPYKKKGRGKYFAEEQRSCGHTAHEYSSASAMRYIFRFFDARLGIKKKDLLKNKKQKQNEIATKDSSKDSSKDSINKDKNENEVCKDEKESEMNVDNNENGNNGKNTQNSEKSNEKSEKTEENTNNTENSNKMELDNDTNDVNVSSDAVATDETTTIANTNTNTSDVVDNDTPMS